MVGGDLRHQGGSYRTTSRSRSPTNRREQTVTHSDPVSPRTFRRQTGSYHSAELQRPMHPMEQSHTQSHMGGGWNDWAMFIVSETKRFAVEIERNEGQMITLRESIADLKITLKGLEVLVTRISKNENDIEEHKTKIEGLLSFKAKATAVSGTVWAVLGIAITILSVFLSQALSEAQASA